VKARTRSLATTLLLVAAAAAAVLAAWWAVDLRGAAEAARTEKAERLFAFEPKEVRELTVEAPAGTTRLVRGEKGFRIPALDAPADAGAVDAILELFAHVRRKAEVAPPGGDEKALAGYGLAKPRVRVTASLDGGRTETLALGDRNAFDGSLYARPTSGAVVLVPGELSYWLDKGPADLKEKPPPAPPPVEKGPATAAAAPADGAPATGPGAPPGPGAAPPAGTAAPVAKSGAPNASGSRRKSDR